LAKEIVKEGLTVRAVEDSVRRHAQEEAAEQEDRTSGVSTAPGGMGTGTAAGAGAHLGGTTDGLRRRLPAPGILELEELLSNYLNTRVKVEMAAKHGKVVIDFATLEDLERIYKLMVGQSHASHDRESTLK
jgi:ParB family chromosome partitioning protein